MSRLALHSRPFVVFNPANKEHRKWFAEFNHSAKWGSCPVRFVVEDGQLQIRMDYRSSAIRPIL